VRDPALPDDLGVRLRELERRLANLERSPMTAGRLSVGPDRFALYAGDGTTILGADAEGLTTPHFAQAMNEADGVQVTSLSFVETHHAIFPSVFHRVLFVVCRVNASAATTGEVKVTFTNKIASTPDPTEESPVLSIGAGVDGYHRLVWDVADIASTEMPLVTVQARRLSGAGHIRVSQATAFFSGPPDAADYTAGAWNS
jgi:hypothetical protein